MISNPKQSLKLQPHLPQAQRQILGPGDQLAPVRVGAALAPRQIKDHIRTIEPVDRRCKSRIAGSSSDLKTSG